jgi:leucyl/phenylalanyl-tRNA---protein transferase
MVTGVMLDRATGAVTVEGAAGVAPEPLAQRARRIALGVAWALHPNRARHAPHVAWATALGFLDAGTLPLATDADDAADGLCGLATDLAPATLAEAYARGLYPFAHVGPLKWWSPPARTVLFFREYHIAKRLRRQMRSDGFTVTFDRAFSAVVRACAQPRAGKLALTWITPRIARAYLAAHEAGLAHSFEVWDAEGALVGGGYGLAFGEVFSTESQFSHAPNASKIGFTVLNWHLAHWGFCLNDGKRPTPTIDGMGFRAIPRDDYATLCDTRGREPGRPGRWSVEADAPEVSRWQPGQGPSLEV